jgi:hypothetical protein
LHAAAAAGAAALLLLLLLPQEHGGGPMIPISVQFEQKVSSVCLVSIALLVVNVVVLSGSSRIAACIALGATPS